jgi:hypothetical protein
MTRLARDAPLITRLAMIIGLTTIPLIAALALDPRLIDGVSIWTKPVKFHAALFIYLITLAYFARYLPPNLMTQRAYRIYETYVAVAIIAELVWISAAAAMGTTSHFNDTSLVWAVLYPIMGLFAVSLTSLSLVHGIAILRHRATGLPRALHLGIGGGLVLTFVATVIVAGTMSASSGHFVGTPSGAPGLWLMGWSREVGDLRAPHFLATHAMHGVPLAALLAQRVIPTLAVSATWAVLTLYATLVGATFWQALMGQPFLPFLG